MNNYPHNPAPGDDEIMAPDELVEELVLSDSESEKEFRRTQWIERVLNQLITLRVRNDLTRRELGERIGKPQTSIARLESSSDIKLSVLRDYLGGLGLTPGSPLAVDELDHEMERLRCRSEEDISSAPSRTRDVA